MNKESQLEMTPDLMKSLKELKLTYLSVLSETQQHLMQVRSILVAKEQKDTLSLEEREALYDVREMLTLIENTTNEWSK